MEVPKFLLRKKYLLETVLFVALFSFVFMAIYQPFSATAWFGFRPFSKFVQTLSFYLAAVVLMLVSKRLFHLFHAERGLQLRIYLLWIGGEFLAITVLYILFTCLFEGGRESLNAAWMMRVFLCVSLILAIPYALITLYMSYREKNEELNLMQLNRSTESRPRSSRLLHLYDNNEVLRMSVDSDTLYYIESQDNYVRIYYELEGKLVSYMLRCQTRRIEEILSDTTLVRCHRSHLVNTTKIKLYKKERDHAKIFLTHPSAKPIPVSKSYFKAVTELIEGHCPTEG